MTTYLCICITLRSVRETWKCGYDLSGGIPAGRPGAEMDVESNASRYLKADVQDATPLPLKMLLKPNEFLNNPFKTRDDVERGCRARESRFGGS